MLDIYSGSILLNRDFHAEKPKQKWVTDVTEFSLFVKKLYLLPILEICSSDLVRMNIQYIRVEDDYIPDLVLP